MSDTRTQHPCACNPCTCNPCTCRDCRCHRGEHAADRPKPPVEPELAEMDHTPRRCRVDQTGAG